MPSPGFALAPHAAELPCPAKVWGVTSPPCRLLSLRDGEELDSEGHLHDVPSLRPHLPRGVRGTPALPVLTPAPPRLPWGGRTVADSRRGSHVTPGGCWLRGAEGLGRWQEALSSRAPPRSPTKHKFTDKLVSISRCRGLW